MGLPGARSSRRRVAGAVLLALVALGAAEEARADYDFSGAWYVLPSSAGVGIRWNVVQNGADLTVTFSPPIGPGDPFPGVIDENTGAFEIYPFQFYPSCGTSTLVGTVAADGRSFVATHVFHYIQSGPATLGGGQCRVATTTLSGSHCGSGTLEDGEDCDDGNRENGDCCSSTCALDAVGIACTDDFNVCTDDVCDGAGACTHDDNTAACADPFGCGTGFCTASSCVITSPQSAGTSCDLDSSVCSVDTCDGAGACAAGGTLDCAPCGVCNDALGCVHDTNACFDDPMSVEVKLKVGENAKYSIRIAEGTPVEDLGDPSTDTQYTLCFFASDESTLGYSRLIYEAIVPPGGTCGTKPCWRSARERFLYKNRYTTNGLTQIKVQYPTNHAFHDLQFKGRGDDLPPLLPTGFASDLLSLTPMFIASDGVTSKCWANAVAPYKLEANEFIGYRSPYSD